MAVPKAVAEHLSHLKADIKKVTPEEQTHLIVAARHCAETFRRYIPVSSSQSLAIDTVVHRCSDLVEALRIAPPLPEASLRPLRRAALESVEDLAATVADAEPLHEAVILQLNRK